MLLPPKICILCFISSTFTCLHNIKKSTGCKKFSMWWKVMKCSVTNEEVLTGPQSSYFLKAVSEHVGDSQTSLCRGSRTVWPIRSRRRWRCSGRRETHTHSWLQLCLRFAAKSPKLHLPGCCGREKRQEGALIRSCGNIFYSLTFMFKSLFKLIWIQCVCVTWSRLPRWFCRWWSDRSPTSLKEPQTPAAYKLLWTPAHTRIQQIYVCILYMCVYTCI